MLKKLKPKLKARSTLLASLNRAAKFLETFEEDAHTDQVQSRLDALNQGWAEFEALQLEIETIEEDVLEEGDDATKLEEQHERIREQFEGLYHKVRAGLTSRLPSGVMSGVASGPTSVARAHVELPKITLPKFSGEYDEWLAFHDTFKSLIHDNKSLTAIQKFHYLRGCLVGEAKKNLDASEFSATSYQVAWDLLVKRHANKYLQKKRYVNGLLQYPRLGKLTASGIHDVVDHFSRCTRILDQLGERTEGWGVMLTQLLVSKLDDVTQTAWEAVAAKQENPQFGDVIAFLEERTKVLDAVAVDQLLERQRSSSSASSVPAPAKKSFPKLTVNAAAETSPSKCRVCSGSHLVFRCPEFKKMSLEDRDKLIMSKKLCRNCLRTGHFAKDCDFKFRCSTCGKKHSTLLHPPEASD